MLKALSIRQPWCHRILHEGKDVENRDWPTKFRGRVLIHASKKGEDGTTAEMDRGGIVGHVEIVDCVDRSDSEWFFGKFGFVLRNPRPLPFIPCLGKLGFFTPDIRAEVLQMHRSDILSEGQAAKILDVPRITLRELADEAA